VTIAVDPCDGNGARCKSHQTLTGMSSIVKIRAASESIFALLKNSHLVQVLAQ
jgi:hypothetical protein